MAARGRPPGPGEKPWRDAIRRAVNRHVGGEGDPKYLDKLADKLVAEALEGSVPALQEIGNRLDGKPLQQTEVSGPQGAPLELIQRTVVDPRNSDA